MYWQTIQHLSTITSSQKREDDSYQNESTFSKVIAVRALVFAQRNNQLGGYIDWQPIFNWLGIDAVIQRPVLSEMTREEKRAFRRNESARRGVHSGEVDLLIDWVEGLIFRSECFESPLNQVIKLLSDRMSLSYEEQKVLLLCWVKLRQPMLSECLRSVCVESETDALRFFEQVLSLDYGSLRSLAFEKNPLYRFNLLRKGMHFRDINAAFEEDDFLVLLNSTMTLSSGNTVDLEVHQSELDDACSIFCPLYSGKTLGPEFFSHVPELQLLKDYISDAIYSQKTGCNILLYGKSGVGKTLLVSSLAKWFGFKLYEVPFENDENEQLAKHLRIDFYLKGQHLLKSKANSLILFDEVEDVFDNWRHAPGKAWLNRTLEQNALPTIWLTNDVSRIDLAYLRRFDLILEVPTPSSDKVLQKRIQLLEALPVTPAFRKWLGESEWLSPALMELVNKLGQYLNKGQPVRNEKKLIKLLEQRLKAEGRQKPKNWYCSSGGTEPAQPSIYTLPSYSEAWLNTDLSLASVVGQIRRIGSARLCLHGYSGTGKTAFGAYLAEKLKKPLVIKSASSLLGKYVGETEKKIAAMFNEAQSAGAILLLDEAETFLQSRMHSDLKSWEVSMVNEMLVQLEKFKGVFVATSNRFEQLDTAVMRRFDLKVAFDWLKPEQLIDLLVQIFGPKPIELKKVLELEPQDLSHFSVSPGGVQSTLRRLELLAKPLKLHLLLDALEDEAIARDKKRAAPIGFIHPGRKISSGLTRTGEIAAIKND